MLKLHHLVPWPRKLTLVLTPCSEVSRNTSLPATIDTLLVPPVRSSKSHDAHSLLNLVCHDSLFDQPYGRRHPEPFRQPGPLPLKQTRHWFPNSSILLGALRSNSSNPTFTTLTSTDVIRTMQANCLATYPDPEHFFHKNSNNLMPTRRHPLRLLPLPHHGIVRLRFEPYWYYCASCQHDRPFPTPLLSSSAPPASALRSCQTSPFFPIRIAA
jgi:hypothetical protein